MYKNNIIEKCTFIASFLCGIFILLPFKAKPLIVILLFILGVCSLTLKAIEFKNFKSIVIYNILFIGYLLSLFYTENINRAFTLLGRHAPLIIIPLSLSFLSDKAKNDFKKQFIKTNIISSVIYSVLLLLYFYKLGFYSKQHDLSYCYWFIENEFWGLHENIIYISISIAVALLFLLDNFKNNIQSFVIFIILILCLFLLARKGVIISFLICGSILLFLKQSRKQVLKIIFVSSLLLLLVLSTIPEIRLRFLELLDIKNTVSSNRTSSGIRYILWNTSSDLITESNYFGYGIGDVQDVLSKKLNANGNQLLAQDNYNAHNQYLQIGLALGIPGIIAFLFSNIYFCKKLYIRQQYTGIVFFSFFLFVSLFESILERQNGIIIYSLITCVYIYTISDKN